jgi:hypothetical protein
MSKIMTIAGIILAAIGLALGLAGLVSPARLGAMFLTLDTAAILLVGGILSMGIGAVISALEAGVSRPARFEAPAEAPLAGTRNRMDDAIRAAASSAKQDAAEALPELRSKQESTAFPAAAGAVAAGAVVLSEQTVPEIAPSSSVAETINALERAKSDMRAAFGGNGGVSGPVTPLKPAVPPVPSVAIPPPADEPEDDAVESEAESEEIAEEAPEAETDAGELYVVEEKMIRGRPARILSDGTVEAETDDGWMRFENLEHLNEYLDG